MQDRQKRWRRAAHLMRGAIGLTREAIRLMREAIRLMRDALSLMREALRPDEGGTRATHHCCGRGGLGAEGTQRTPRHAA